MLRRFLRHGFLPLLLGLYVWLSIGGSQRVGLAYDEPVHIVSGLYYNTTGDYRFQPENGVLPQRLQALPWILAGVKPPALDGFHWEHAEVWELSTRMMDGAGEQRQVLLQRSRLVSALAGALVLLLIYRWSLDIYGIAGATLVVSLAALCPNLVAHGGLATTDAWGVLGALTAVLAWWRLCHRVSPGRVLVAGLAAGFFAVCKFSCVLLAPIAVVLVLIRLLRKTPLPWSFGKLHGRTSGASRLLPLSVGSLTAVALTVLVIWANYGFRYSASPGDRGEFISSWSSMLIEQPETVGLAQLGEPLEHYTTLISPGPLQTVIAFTRDHRLLPEAWLYGLAFVGRNAQSRLSYFAGEYSVSGWRAYFPMAFLLKSTPGGLLALLCALAAWTGIKSHGRLAYRLTPVLVLVVVVFGTAISSSINIGLRHILPAIVGGWMLCGAVLLMQPSILRRVLLSLLAAGCVAQAVSTIRVHPHALTYFNALAGDHPDYWLADSNLDWGQGLPELSVWLEANPEKRPVYLSYFGTDNPKHYNIEAFRFADFPFDREALALPAELSPGWYCFGPTQYRRVYTDTRGPWTQTREAIYQKTLGQVLELVRLSRADNPSQTTNEDIELLKRFDSLRLARLGLYLQNRKPDFRLPGSIMVYHLSDADLQLAFYATLPRLTEALLQRE